LSGKSAGFHRSVSWSVPDGELNEEVDLEAGTGSGSNTNTNSLSRESSGSGSGTGDHTNSNTNTNVRPISLASRSITMAFSAVSEILK